MGFLRRVSITLIVLALLIASLNLYMNVMINYSLPSMQLDLSVDGDLFGFHEMQHEADGHLGRGAAPSAVPAAQSATGSTCMGLCVPGWKENQTAYVSRMIAKYIRSNRLKQVILRFFCFS